MRARSVSSSKADAPKPEAPASEPPKRDGLAPAARAKPEQPGGLPIPVEIGMIVIQEGRAQFVDRTTAPPFTETISRFGLTIEPATADVDNSALNSTFDTKTIGRDSFSGTMLRFKKQASGDTAWTTLVRGTTGYIVVRRYMDNATAYASAQPVNVYPIICGQRRELKPEANSVARWEVDTKITSTPAIYVNIA